MARKLHLAEGCTLCFPRRSEDFAEGVEIGILAAQMDSGESRLSRWVGARNLDQIRSLADRLGYRVTLSETDGDWVHISLWRGPARPQLKLVYHQ